MKTVGWYGGGGWSVVAVTVGAVRSVGLLRSETDGWLLVAAVGRRRLLSFGTV